MPIICQIWFDPFASGAPDESLVLEIEWTKLYHHHHHHHHFRVLLAADTRNLSTSKQYKPTCNVNTQNIERGVQEGIIPLESCSQ